jgi:hypothetical protein
MTPLAHHAGEETLATLLLLGGGGTLPLVVAMGRARLTAARARLTGRPRRPPHRRPAGRATGVVSRSQRSA